MHFLHLSLITANLTNQIIQASILKDSIIGLKPSAYCLTSFHLNFFLECMFCSSYKSFGVLSKQNLLLKSFTKSKLEVYV